MRVRLAWLGLVAGVIACTLPGLAQSSSPPFTMAVLRRDGVLVPFASFTGERFERAWPEAEGRAEVPATLDAMPADWWPDERPQLEWRFQPLDGEPRSIEVEGPIWVPVQCQQQTALLTDYRTAAPPPPPDVQPYPKEGLAWTGDIGVEPIEVLTRDDPAWQRLGRELAGLMNEREEEAIAQMARLRWRHPATEEERQQRSPALEAAYAAGPGDGGGRVYYVEATKRYKRPPRDRDADCDVVSFLSGWARIDGKDRVAAIHLQGAVTACDYSSVPIMHPLALVRLNDRPLWVVQWSTWGYEKYEVLAASAEHVQVLFETTAGVCDD